MICAAIAFVAVIAAFFIGYRCAVWDAEDKFYD